MTSSTAGSATGPAGSYRPFLDGLRAVAVYLVVVFHAGADRFTGGFLGVDVFFVLSGFLVTQLLLRDLSATGTISFRRFYARRFRRLLPAAFVVLIITAMVFTAIASPVEVTDAQDGFRAAFLYAANWHFITQSSDYFGADLATNPVLHFWSLAVEEQFYLLWPLLLGGLYALTRRFGTRQTHTIRLVVAAGAIASVTWAWILKDTNPNRAYYGTDTRAYQLMAGAFLALTPGLFTRLARYTRPARHIAIAALAALIAIATSWIHLDPIERGIAATAITVTLLIALETANSGPLHQALSLEPVTYLGRISYGTYLWHWPVIIVMTRQFQLAPLTTVALTALIATALASLSYQLLEHPIRISPLLDRHRNTVITTGLTLSAISALLLIPTITNTPTTTTTPGNPNLTTTGFTPVPTGLDYNAIRAGLNALSTCYGEATRGCTIVEGTGPHILLMGDSHAGMLIPTFTTLAETNDLTLSVTVRGGCPWQRNLYHGPREVCEELKDDTYDRVIPALDPDIIILMNLGDGAIDGFVKYKDAGGRARQFGSPEYGELLDQTTADSLAALEAGERKIVILEPIPWGLVNQLMCLSEATVIEACRAVDLSDPSHFELLYRHLDEDSDRVWSVDLDRFVCPFLPICDPIVDRRVTRIDQTHLTSDFARSLAPAMTDYLKSNGILPA